MSSHREAPEIAKDPVADSTDVYAFVSPDRPDTVTLIANYIPLEGPAGGPNFYAFGDEVLYEIHIDNDADARADITYQFCGRSSSCTPSQLGVVGGDLAGFPNGRRVFDDVVTIELRAIAGVTVPLVDSTFTPDAAASPVTDGLTATSVPSGYLDAFPYLGVPYSGFSTPSS